MCLAVNAACSTYTIPQNFTQDKTFEFDCQPLLIDDINVTHVRWRKFRDYNDLLSFQDLGTRSDNFIIQTSDIFSMEGSMNQTLRVTSSEVAEAMDVVYYFVPSFVMEGNDSELVTAETAIYGMARMLFAGVGCCCYINHIVFVYVFFCCHFHRSS